MSFSPGMAEIAFKALRTRNARSAAIPGMEPPDPPNFCMTISRYLHEENKKLRSDSVKSCHKIIKEVEKTSVSIVFMHSPPAVLVFESSGRPTD